MSRAVMPLKAHVPIGYVNVGGNRLAVEASRELVQVFNALQARLGGASGVGPSAPTGLGFSDDPGGVRVYCDANPDAEQVIAYQWRLGATWDGGTVLVSFGTNNEVIPSSDVGTYTVWVAAADVRGNYSTPSSMEVTVTADDIGIYGPSVTLAANGLAFVKLKNGGGLTPASILLTAITLNLPTPTYVWKVDDVEQVGETGSSFSLTAFDDADSHVVRCDVTSGALTAYDVYTIYRVNEGDDAIIAGLSNENHTVLVNSSGTAVAGLPAAGTMTVARGATVLASGVAYSVASTSSATASINASTGVYSVTAIAADAASVTFRATVSGVTYDKVMSLNKSYPGTNGTNGSDGSDGARGSLKGYGSQYSISSSSWSDAKANRVIDNMLTGGTSTADLATTSHLRIGDTVQLTNGTSFVESRHWSGSAWLTAATVIEGNVLVNGSGTFTGDLNGGANINITGSAIFDGASSVGGASASAIVNSSANVGGGQVNGLIAYTANVSGTGVQGIAVSSGGIGVYGVSAAGYGMKAAASTGSATALVVQGWSASSPGLAISNGTFGWGSSTWAMPSGTGLFCANGTWLAQSTFATAGHNHSGVYLPVGGTAADSSALGGTGAAGWCRVIVGNTGTANASGAGFNMQMGTGLAPTYEVACSSNNIILQTASDRTLKQDIEDEPQGLAFLQQLRPRQFRFISDPEYLQHGFIAQEVAEVATPNGEKDALAFTREDGIMGINHLSLIAPLVKATQELAAEVGRLSVEVAALKGG